MITRTRSWLVILAAAVLTAACDSTETRTASMTTSSPAGTSTVPSSAAAEQRDNEFGRKDENAAGP